MCTRSINGMSLVGRVSAGRRAGSGAGAQGPGAGMRAGPGRGAGRALAPTTGGAGTKYQCQPLAQPRSCARRSTPRRPAPAPAHGRHPRRHSCTCMRRRQCARVSARVATVRHAGRVAHLLACESIKATASRFRHSYPCAPGSPRGCFAGARGAISVVIP